MDTTSRFFAKLRKVAVNVETQSAELLRAYESRNDDDDDDDDEEKTQRAMRACYELSSEVKEIKSQVQADLKQQRQRMTEVDRFLDACTVMKRKVGEDMEIIRKHCEKYGYQAPQNQQKTLSTEQQQEDADDVEAGRAAEDAEKVGDEGDPHPAAPNLQRTPQFSDFGLSEANLRRRMMAEAADGSGEAEFSGAGAAARGGAVAAAAASSLYLRSPQFSDFGLSEVDVRKRLQGPDVAAPSPYCPPSLYVSGLTPKTPKCTLRMDDDDEMRTPQAPYFGVYSEHTMCLNNDFTMDLQRKDVQLQAAESSTVSVLHPGTDGSTSYVDGMFLSPNPSVQHIRSKGAYGRASSPPPPEETPLLKKQALSMPLKSPEVPQAYLNIARSLGKKHTGATSVPANGGQPDWDLPTPANRTNPDQAPWEYDVPEMVLDDVVRTPETPVLESDLWLQLAGSRGVVSGKTEPVEPSVPSLKLDDPMKSPMMPDLSSETLTNIQQLLERKTAVVLPNHRSLGKENRITIKVISEVTQAEFQRLPSYLRQMPLSSLNQAVQKLNQAAADSQHDENKEFSMSDLKKMAGLDTPVSKAPVYFLCLTELSRLKQVRGVGMNSEYRLVTK